MAGISTDNESGGKRWNVLYWVVDITMEIPRRPIYGLQGSNTCWQIDADG